MVLRYAHLAADHLVPLAEGLCAFVPWKTPSHGTIRSQPAKLEAPASLRARMGHFPGSF